MKKIVLFLLAGLMVFATMAGCASPAETEPSKAPESQAPASVAPSEAPESQAPASQAPEAKYPGAVGKKSDFDSQRPD